MIGHAHMWFKLHSWVLLFDVKLQIFNLIKILKHPDCIIWACFLVIKTS